MAAQINITEKQFSALQKSIEDLLRNLLPPNTHSNTSSGSKISTTASPIQCCAADPKINGHAPNNNVDIDAASTYLRSNVSKKRWGEGKCASFVANAINSAGGNLSRTIYAKDFGPHLITAGYTKYTAPASYADDPSQWKKGDVAVIQPYGNGNTEGHMAMFDGESWVSDFVQRDMWGGQTARQVKPPYKIYRP